MAFGVQISFMHKEKPRLRGGIEAMEIVVIMGGEPLGQWCLSL